MPRAEVIAVVALASRSGLLSPILKVRRRAALPILVVPQGRFSALLEFAPRGAIAVLKLREGDGIVDQVPHREDRPRNPVDQFGGRQSALRVLAPDDVASAYKDCTLVD
jgi:hypothetical protein